MVKLASKSPPAKPAAVPPIPATSADGQPYSQLKATLRGIEPPIWRRMLVPSRLTLPNFHAALQIAFGWDDSHLHAFRVGKESYQAPDPDSFDSLGGNRDRDETAVRVGDLLTKKGAKLLYVYDFGDDWTVEVTLENILPDLPPMPVSCLAGARSGPPEDSGGIGGYEGLLAAIADPKHPEHEELREWLGEEFNPEEFDLKAINARLKKIKA